MQELEVEEVLEAWLRPSSTGEDSFRLILGRPLGFTTQNTLNSPLELFVVASCR